MPSDLAREIMIRPMRPEDRTLVEQIVSSVANFNKSERECALELVDIYLQDDGQADYRVAVASGAASAVGAYCCWGPVPLTRGAYDLYWIATHPNAQGKGFGQALMKYVEDEVLNEDGRLLIIETSSKESYGNTVGFYRRIGYEEASRIADFYDVGDDKLTFVKRLSR